MTTIKFPLTGHRFTVIDRNWLLAEADEPLGHVFFAITEVRRNHRGVQRERTLLSNYPGRLNLSLALAGQREWLGTTSGVEYYNAGRVQIVAEQKLVWDGPQGYYARLIDETPDEYLEAAQAAAEAMP